MGEHGMGEHDNNMETDTKSRWGVYIFTVHGVEPRCGVVPLPPFHSEENSNFSTTINDPQRHPVILCGASAVNGSRIRRKPPLPSHRSRPIGPVPIGCFRLRKRIHLG